MNLQPVGSVIRIQEKVMVRKMFWAIFSLVMMLLSFGLVFVSAVLRLPLDLFLLVSLIALSNVWVASSLFRQVCDE